MFSIPCALSAKLGEGSYTSTELSNASIFVSGMIGIVSNVVGDFFRVSVEVIRRKRGGGRWGGGGGGGGGVQSTTHYRDDDANYQMM